MKTCTNFVRNKFNIVTEHFELKYLNLKIYYNRCQVGPSLTDIVVIDKYDGLVLSLFLRWRFVTKLFHIFIIGLSIIRFAIE